MRRHGEAGVALVAAIAIMVIAAFIVVAIMISARASSDGARSQQRTAATEQLARDAGTALAESFNALQSGEHDGYVLTKPMLEDHAAKIGGTVVANTDLPEATLRAVDPRVPGSAQFTMSQPLDSGITGFWQVYSVKLPTYGVTRGGRVLEYVRVWTTANGRTTQPTMYRLEFRPTWFADYQLVADGPIKFGDGAVISGRVHSNGFSASYYNQYRDLGKQIVLDTGASCEPTAVITTANGQIGGAVAGSCGRTKENTGRQYNFLRARDAATRMRYICEHGGHPSLSMACPTTDVTDVKLTTDSVIVNGTAYPASVAGDAPGQRQGAVVIAEGDVNLSGTLGPHARALVVTAARRGSSDYGRYGAPSIWIRGNVGAAAAATSSFGAVAEGDVIFDEQSIESATARGAFLTMSGMVSHNPRWRGIVAVNGGHLGDTVRIEGSIAGHFPPMMHSEGNHAGFDHRQYVWTPSLFDDPPPLYPTAADWEVTRLEVANLDCFLASGALDTTRGDCS